MAPTSLARPSDISLAERVPAQLFFVVSAVFHYLGPAFAVLLFAQIAPLGVAWLRIASAAVIFAVWRRPWRYYRTLDTANRQIVIMLGIVLAAMNACFYVAIDRLPLGTLGAIEFLRPIRLAAALGVGISSSVIPYVCDQLAMARLKRASFALLLALLPATASAIGILVLRQIPSPAEIAGIALVIAAVALHRAEAD